MTGTPEPLKCRLGECRDCRSELRRHGILHRHVRPVTAGGAQGLPGQKCFSGHPVTVVRGDEGAINVATGQGSGGSGLNSQHRPADQSLSQAAEIIRFIALQAIPVNEELNGPLPACPARYARSRLPFGQIVARRIRSE